MRKSDLELVLSKFEIPEKFKISLEQYFLPSSIASDILFLALISRDIKGKRIADLGCGNGILGLGAYLLGASEVFLVDIDQEVLEVAKRNYKKIKGMGAGKVYFLKKDVRTFRKKVDTVLQNPPFGSKHKHYDILFLETSLRVGRKIYSLHKYDGKKTILFFDKWLKENDAEIMIYKIYEIPIKKIYPFHKKPVKKVKAVLLKILNHSF